MAGEERLGGASGSSPVPGRQQQQQRQRVKETTREATCTLDGSLSVRVKNMNKVRMVWQEDSHEPSIPVTRILSRFHSGPGLNKPTIFTAIRMNGKSMTLNGERG